MQENTDAGSSCFHISETGLVTEITHGLYVGVGIKRQAQEQP